jgi:5-methylcytosine-specific restriction enzyme B
MRIWKLGTIWGTGSPDFTDLIRDKKIALSHLTDTRGYLPKKGEIIIITKGQTVKAITYLLEEMHPVTDDLLLENLFDDYKIDYDNNVIFGNVEWIDLAPTDYYQYKLQDGICEVNKKEIIDTTIFLLNKYRKQNTMEEVIKLLTLKNQIILQGPPGTGKTYTAKDIAESIVFGDITAEKEEQKIRLETTEQFKLIQFHPAYSYEDFVRGISAENNNGAITYKTKNKILGDFAKKAFENYNDSRKDSKQLSEENWLEENFYEFTEYIIDEIEKNNGKLILPETTTYLKEVEEDCFRYTGDNWNNTIGNRMHFRDILEMYRQNIKQRQDIKKMKGVSGLAVQHASYFLKVLDKFYKFMSGKNKPVSEDNKVKEKPFLLIIDEINRANLPAVLGELIYALEYRGEKVESMYDIDGDNSLVLPPNLYIIGTMNNADRSVGHIDYAIRRRFAFVDVLPSPNPVHILASPLFKKVSELFIKNYDNIDWSNPIVERSDYLASDFRPEDVWIGHSYFISTKDNDDEARAEMNLKRDYEIIPLLKEYLKDGILLEAASNLIKEIKELAI